MNTWQLPKLSHALQAGDYARLKQPDGANWRTRVIIPMENGIVAVESHTFKDDPRFWYLPGGGMEGDETLIECGIREVQEETGLEVRIKRLMYIREFADIPAVEFFLLAEHVSGKLIVGYDPEPDAMPLTDVRIISFDELENRTDLIFYPIGLRKQFRSDLKKQPEKAVYIGAMP